MAKGVSAVISTYQQCLLAMPFVLATSYGRTTRGGDGVAMKLFITFPFSHPDVRLQFLKDVGLFIPAWRASTCGCQMTMPEEYICFSMFGFDLY
jgi:hypothetical protein